jgi:hypothetical protein
MSGNELANTTDQLDVNIVQLDRLAGDVLRNIDNFAREYGYSLLRGVALPVGAASELACILQDCSNLVGVTRSIGDAIAGKTSQHQPQL